MGVVNEQNFTMECWPRWHYGTRKRVQPNLNIWIRPEVLARVSFQWRLN